MSRPPFFIVFSPDGPTPPTKVYDDHKPAFAIANLMARQHPGQTFHVMKSTSRPIVVEADAPDEGGEA